MHKFKYSVIRFRNVIMNPWHVAMIVLLALHLTMLMLHFKPAISTPDANGYLAQARLIANYGHTWFEPESPLQFIGTHWLRAENGRYFSRYPPGLPTILAIPYKLAGPFAALLINPILTTLTLLGLFMLCSLWLGKKFGFVAALIMALNPMVNSFALTQDAHAATAFFAVWGIYLLARWSKTLSPSLAFFIGLCWGIIPSIRYAEGLFCLAMGLFITLHLNRGRAALRSMIMAFIGALIPVSVLLIHNQLAFGSFWKTAYSLTHEQTGFGLQYFMRNALPYLKNIMISGAGLFAVLGWLGMVMMCTQHRTRRTGIFFIALVLPITLLYMSYYFVLPHMPGATMRFLLPTFYVYAVAGVWLLKIMADKWHRPMRAAIPMVVVITGAWGLPQSLMPLKFIKETNTTLVAITRIVEEHVKPGDIIIAPPPIPQHLDFIGQWRLGDAMWFGHHAEGSILRHQKTNPDKPGPMQIEEKQLRLQRYTDTSGRLSAVLLHDLDTWAKPNKRVYWIGILEAIEHIVPSSDHLEVVARIKIPHTIKRPDIKPQQPHTPHRLLHEPNKKPPPRAFTGATEFVLVEWKREQ